MLNYEVWAGDLNSLYDETPRPEVLVETYESFEEAESEKKKCSNAAWVLKVYEEDFFGPFQGQGELQCVGSRRVVYYLYEEVLHSCWWRFQQ